MRRQLLSTRRAVAGVRAGWWVVLLALPALAPLSRQGFFSSHDGLIHAYRLAALDRAVRQGVILPRWFPDFAFGYGHPVLNFYGPLGYYLGLPLTLVGVDPVWAIKTVFALGLVGSALGMYLFARLHLGRGPAVVAAGVYAALPYHLVDLYVRGALAEFLAFAWFPLILWSLHRLLRGQAADRLRRAGIAALLLAALVITHSLSAMIFAPVAAAYALLLILTPGDRSGRSGAITALVLAGMLALGLSAFYWLPVLTESANVGLREGASPGYRDHLMPWNQLFSRELSYDYGVETTAGPAYPLGAAQVAIIVAACSLLLIRRQRRWPLAFFAALALLSAFMLTTGSLPIWRALEMGLAYLQYPFRIQALTTLATAFLAGALHQALSQRLSGAAAPLGVVIVGIVTVSSLARLPYTAVTPDLSAEAMWSSDRATGQVGATWTGEYLPVWVTEQRWALSLPDSGQPVGLDDEALPDQLKLLKVGYTSYTFAAASAQPFAVVLHQFYTPGWLARWQDATFAAEPVGALGLARFSLPPGDGTLVLRLGLTPAQLGGTLFSAIAALGLGCWLAFQERVRLRINSGNRSRWFGAAPAVFAIVACAFLAIGLTTHLVTPNGRSRQVIPVHAVLGDTIDLLAAEIDGDRYTPGDTLSVSLYWRALQPLDGDYKAFVHVTDSAMTHQPTQHDSAVGGGFTPVSRWLPGEVLHDAHHVPLPPDLAPGQYRVWAGMYEHGSSDNLAIVRAEAPSEAGRLLLGEITVVAP